MIRARKLCDLDVSAASGLVVRGDRLYVVADDELFLSVYDRDGRPQGRVALFDGALPEAHAARKAAKPDLESLAILPDGSCLALGSGSTPNRARGSWISPSLAPRIVDLGPLYAHLSAHELPELNIEGAAVCGNHLRLLQRGNGAARDNAVLDLDLAAALAALRAGRPWDASLVRGIRRVALGERDGVPLSFTDAAPWDDGATLFTAAAEDTADAYEDGPCAGSVIGLLSADGARVVWSEAVEPILKIEGIARAGDGGRDVLLVCDPDDRRVLAPLLTATLPTQTT